MSAAAQLQVDDEEVARAKAELWQRGVLTWKLHSSQLDVYERLRALPRRVRTAVALISRRWGKSWLCCCMGLEDCIQNPGVNVFIIAPSLVHANKITLPIMRKVTADAPKGLVKQTKSNYTWTFPNGSTLTLGSFDTAPENARGSEAFAIYFEETGFVETLEEYEYTIKSIFQPTLLHSQGRMTHFTTPPKVPDHPFVTDTIPEAEIAEALFVRTIYDNPLLTSEQIEKEKEDHGGEDSISWKREFLARIERDERVVICPEFDEKLHVKPIVLPRFYRTWIGGDLGGTRDHTAIYLCSYDFERNVVQVVAEAAYDNQTPTSTIAKGIKQLETTTPVPPRRKWIDGSGQTLTDLRVDHQVVAALPDKQDFDAGVNMIRAAFSKGLIEIDPSCKLLIATLRSGTFNKNRNDYARTPALGHMDAHAALVYAYRMRIRENPIPHNLGLHRETHHVTDDERQSQAALVRAFRPNF